MPFLFAPSRSIIPIVAIMSFISYSASSTSSSLYSEWTMNCLSKETIVGNYNAVRIAVFYTVTLLTNLVSAKIMEINQGDAEVYSYMYLGIIAIFSWLASAGMLTFVKEPYTPMTQNSNIAGLKTIFTYKRLRAYFIYSIIYYVGLYLMSPLSNVFFVFRE